MQEDLIARHEALQLEASQSAEALRLAKRAAASMEAYLGVLQNEASEAAARNESQQRRLEMLTAENSKLKKESTKLRSEVTGSRMAAFEQDLLQQELRGAKDAAAAMEAQLSRLHAENAALREGGGLRDELQIATEQLREALDSKAQLQIAMTAQARRAHPQAALIANHSHVPTPPPSRHPHGLAHAPAGAPRLHRGAGGEALPLRRRRAARWRAELL